MSNAAKSFLLALFLGAMAWGSTRIYATYCVPEGFSGFLQSLVTMDSSPCQAVFALISHSNTLYASMITAMLFGIFSGFQDFINLWTAPRRLTNNEGCECPVPPTDNPKRRTD